MAQKRKRGKRGDGSTSYDSGRHRWRATFPRPESGTYSKYFATEADADTWREGLIAARDRSQLAVHRKRIEDALNDHLTEKRRYIREQTDGSYTFYAEHINGQLGDMATGDVDLEDVMRMDAALRKGLSAQTCDHILGFFSGLFRVLMARRALTWNPVAAYLETVPARARGGTPPRKAVILTPETAAIIVQDLYAHEERLANMIALLLCLPFRVGEATGLRWSAYDSKVIHITEQITTRGATAIAAHSEPKTAASVRDYPVTPLVQALFDRQRIQVLEERKVATTWVEHGLIFPNERGGHVHRQAIYRALDRVYTRLEIPHTTIHDLRHSSSSGLLSLGCPEVFVAALLGHGPKTITRHYARPSMTALAPWCNGWAAQVFGLDEAPALEGTLDKQSG